MYTDRDLKILVLDLQVKVNARSSLCTQRSLWRYWGNAVFNDWLTHVVKGYIFSSLRILIAEYGIVEESKSLLYLLGDMPLANDFILFYFIFQRLKAHGILEKNVSRIIYAHSRFNVSHF